MKYAKNAPFTRLPDVDGYAPQVGHANGFAAGRDPKTQTTWLAHCLRSHRVARGNEIDSGNGSSLYAVTGHAPRNLDRNITVVGKKDAGYGTLSTLPRGTGTLDFTRKLRNVRRSNQFVLLLTCPEAERTLARSFPY